MRIFTTFLIAVFFLLLAVAPKAGTVNDCVQLARNSWDGVDIVNRCNQKINVTFCVDNPKSSFACSRRALGMKTLGPGESEWIPFYNDDERGTVRVAACIYPEAAVASSWNWRGHSYRCQ